MSREDSAAVDGVAAGGPAGPRVQVAVGGAVGAGGRALMVTAVGVGAAGWPWGVLAVNLAGALLLGLVVGRARSSLRVARWAPLVGTGIAGSLTTFSTLVVDLAQLSVSHPATAWGYAAVSMTGGAVLAWVGLRVGRGDRRARP